MSRIVQPLEPENVKDVNIVDVPPIFEYQKILGETIVAKDEAKVSEINANTYATQAKTIANNLPTLVNDYVAEHKEELKGGDGKDGKDGKDGVNGVDGKSVTVIKNDNGADVVDGYGNVVTITNGADGKNGVNGQNGADGKDGKSVSVTKIDNGARVTDGNGNVVDVLNGKDGEIPADKLAQIDSNTELLNDELLQIQRLTEDKIDDVQINGASVKNGTVANIPWASTSGAGVVRILDSYGISVYDYARIGVAQAGVTEFDGRSSLKPITMRSFDLAVKKALCTVGNTEGNVLQKPLIWNEQEKQNARQRLGVAIVTLTQAEYDALEVKSADTTYLVTESD